MCCARALRMRESSPWRNVVISPNQAMSPVSLSWTLQEHAGKPKRQPCWHVCQITFAHDLAIRHTDSTIRNHARIVMQQRLCGG